MKRFPRNKRWFALSLFLGGCVMAQAQILYSISGRVDDPEMEGRKVYLRWYEARPSGWKGRPPCLITLSYSKRT